MVDRQMKDLCITRAARGNTKRTMGWPESGTTPDLVDRDWAVPGLALAGYHQMASLDEAESNEPGFRGLSLLELGG